MASPPNPFGTRVPFFTNPAVRRSSVSTCASTCISLPTLFNIYIRSARTTATSAEKAGNAAAAAALMMGSVDQVLRGHPLGAAQTASAVGWQSVVARMGLLHTVQSMHTLSVLSDPAVLSHWPALHACHGAHLPSVMSLAVAENVPLAQAAHHRNVPADGSPNRGTT